MFIWNEEYFAQKIVQVITCFADSVLWKTGANSAFVCRSSYLNWKQMVNIPMAKKKKKKKRFFPFRSFCFKDPF